MGEILCNKTPRFATNKGEEVGKGVPHAKRRKSRTGGGLRRVEAGVIVGRGARTGPAIRCIRERAFS